MQKLFYISALCSAVLFTETSFAAKPIDLKNQPNTLLPALLAQIQLKPLRSDLDFNQTSHARFQQMYLGYPVWGADIVVHTTKTKTKFMNGIIYQNLENDLRKTPSYFLKTTQQKKALQRAQQKILSSSISQEKINTIIYIDKNNKAHWAFLISYLIQQKNNVPSKPIFILDAVSLKIFEKWENIQTLNDTEAGGLGGNEKSGKINYDGLKNNFPALMMQREAQSKTCYLKNTDVTVKNVRKKNEVMNFPCSLKDAAHNNIYWNADHDAINGAFSPSNDALFVGQVVKEMYQKWYGIPVLTENGKPMMLTMRVHENMENAYWDGSQMTFGDGGSSFYPLVSLGVGAHEISHGFTEQHSNLQYRGQSGGLNESFSDMAAQAAEFYATGKNSWQIGPEIMKEKNQALRYMDEPTKDCNGSAPGHDCSISHVKDYRNHIDVHFSSGIFNKVFYLLGTAKNWNTQKAFNVMTQANQYYWTSVSSFQDAAWGILKATEDYKYPSEPVKNALASVGIDTAPC